MSRVPVSLFTALTTPRLLLRYFHMGDLPTLLAYRNDPEIARYQSWSSLSERDASHFIKKMAAAQPGTPGEWFQFAIERSVDNSHIGDVGLHTLPDARLGEIGYTLAARAQRQGYASESVRAVLAYAFGPLRMHRIAATVDVENKRSILLLERLGFRREGTTVEAAWIRDRWCSDHLYALLARDWRR